MTKAEKRKLAVQAKRERNCAIAKAKKTPLEMKFPPRNRAPMNITNHVDIGDTVRRKNANIVVRNGQKIPVTSYRTYKVAECTLTGRWFKVKGDTKWHNANGFVIEKREDSELQKIVKKVMEDEQDQGD